MWRVFIGLVDEDGDVEYSIIDKTVSHWLDAKMIILDHLRQFESDECSTCEADAAQAVEVLTLINHATNWSGEVEGNEYTICKVEVP